MKNKRIIDSWNKIEPDSTADERMLDTILARNHSGKTENGKLFIVNKTFSWKRLASIAACFVLLIAVTAVVGNNANWFRSSIYTETLGENGVLSFYKSNVPGTASLDFGVDVTSRDLTADENIEIFGKVAVSSAYATFNAEDKSLLHIEAKTTNAKIILAAPGLPTTDTVIDTNAEDSIICGVPVSAGYFVTDKNSEGIRNIIYFASFTLNDISVYVELGGAEVENEIIRGNITSVIVTIIQNGGFNFSNVTG